MCRQEVSENQDYNCLISEANRMHKLWGYEWTVHRGENSTYFLCGPYSRTQLGNSERWGHEYPIVYSTNELYEDQI